MQLNKIDCKIITQTQSKINKIEQFTTNGYYHHITNGPDITPEEIELTQQKCEETIKKMREMINFKNIYDPVEEIEIEINYNFYVSKEVLHEENYCSSIKKLTISQMNGSVYDISFFPKYFPNLEVFIYNKFMNRHPFQDSTCDLNDVIFKNLPLTLKKLEINCDKIMISAIENIPVNLEVLTIADNNFSKCDYQKYGEEYVTSILKNLKVPFGCELLYKHTKKYVDFDLSYEFKNNELFIIEQPDTNYKPLSPSYLSKFVF